MKTTETEQELYELAEKQNRVVKELRKKIADPNISDDRLYMLARDYANTYDALHDTMRQYKMVREAIRELAHWPTHWLNGFKSSAT